MVEQPAVNRRVTGSSPVSGANFLYPNNQGFSLQGQAVSGASVSGFVSKNHYLPTIRNRTGLTGRLHANGTIQKLGRLDMLMKTACRLFNRNNSTNHGLRLLHNLAVAMGWLPWPLIPAKQWPKITPKKRRGVRAEEHKAIIGAEQNVERRHYYQFLWETGAAQTDAANMAAENIDWKNRQIVYRRAKTDTTAPISIGEGLERLLAELPQSGHLFPKIRQTNISARPAEFCRRLRTVGLKGISLHSSRYGWAERAYEAGYPERWAQCLGTQKPRCASSLRKRSTVPMRAA